MLDTQTVDLIKESCLLHLEYTKSNSSACLERGGISICMLGPTTARLVVAVCALCGCNTAREEKQEKQQRGGGGALVLWYRGGSSFGIGQRLQLQWFYCHTN